MASIYTVSQITTYIKHMFEQDFALNRVSVKGEVSNCKYHTSGHLYFTLKDYTGAMSCVMFAGARKSSDVRLKDGMKIIAQGSVRVFERDGKYQLYVSEMKQDGLGDLYLMFEKQKRELEEMGMFAPEYKKPIPKYARRVGIVTSPTGAAIQDIINISRRRNPYVQLILCPAQVQGFGAAESIVRAIETLDAMGLDCMIIGRGGGSIEDLWAFNEEAVARAIFECETPTISAVGHETDTTIADFVADRRAPTPSAAAELAVFDYNQLEGMLLGAEERFRQAMERKVEETVSRMEQGLLRLRLLHPKAGLLETQKQLNTVMERMTACMEREVRRYQYKLGIQAEKLQAVSPLQRLSGGYALITDQNEKPIEGITQIPNNGEVYLHMKDGIAQAKVETLTKRVISAVQKGDSYGDND